MSKIKRNDLCPCGSGKKYKHCCGFANPVNTNIQRVNDDLHKLHQTFVSAVTDDYRETLANLQTRYHRTDIEDDTETAEIYQTGLALWLLFHVPYGSHRTIFADFFRKHTRGLSKRTRELFASWQNRLPSAYEVAQVDEDNHLLVLKDCQDEQTYRIPYHPDEDFIEGSVLIGTLVPFVNQYGFFYTVIKLYRHNPEHVAQLLATYSQEGDGLRTHFPDFLAETLLLGQEEADWNRSIHEDVAQLFADHLVAKNIEDEMLFQGAAFWQRYTQKVNPSLQKPQPYAAALEYLVQKDWLKDTTVTQEQIANEYDCTSASVSANYRKLVAELDAEQT